VAVNAFWARVVVILAWLRTAWVESRTFAIAGKAAALVGQPCHLTEEREWAVVAPPKDTYTVYAYLRVRGREVLLDVGSNLWLDPAFVVRDLLRFLLAENARCGGGSYRSVDDAESGSFTSARRSARDTRGPRRSPAPAKKRSAGCRRRSTGCGGRGDRHRPVAGGLSRGQVRRAVLPSHQRNPLSPGPGYDRAMRWPFRRRADRPKEPWDFSTVLLNLGPNAPFTIGNSYQHVHCWSSTGGEKRRA
jgi:hypothetical protein